MNIFDVLLNINGSATGDVAVFNQLDDITEINAGTKIEYEFVENSVTLLYGKNG